MFLIDMATLVKTQVTHYTNMEQYIEEPRINAQGTRMVLTVYGDTMQETGKLKVYNVSGSGSWEITPPEGVLGTADFHPDGEHILVTAGASFENLTDLVSVKYDGTGWTKIATAPGIVRYPRWSPDGTRIAMVMTIMNPDNYETGLWIYDINTSQFTKIVGGQYSIECPSWSPIPVGGGDSIVYQTDQNDPGGFFVDLYTINPDTLEGGLLIDDDAPMDKHPSYSPDGLSVMYTRYSESLIPGVYVYMVDTHQSYQITSDTSMANSPCWSWNW
jgi:Tol biopolymer transport system component